MVKCAERAPTGAKPAQLRLKESAPLPELELGDVAAAVYDALPFFFMLVDSNHTILFANRAVREALGKGEHELVGCYCPAAIHGLDEPFPGCPLEEAAVTHVAVERDFYEKALGAWVNSAIYPTSIRTAAGRPVYAHLVQDVSKRRNAQVAVRERADVEKLISRLATHFLGASPDRIQDALGKALRMVAAFMDCTRYAEYQAGDTPGRLMLASSWQDPNEKQMFSELPASIPLDDVTRAVSALRAKDSSNRESNDGAPSEHSVLVPISVGGGSVNGCIRFDQWAAERGPRLRDPRVLKLLASTLSVGLERLRAAQQLSFHAERLRSMALELSAAEERERRRIAADLHDQIGQTLALSLMKVSSLRSESATPRTSAVLEELHEHIQAALSDAKLLMFELSPPVLHQFGLGAALEWLLEQCEARHGLRCTLHDETRTARLNDDQEMFLFRAVQELVANVQRHAHAKSIDVRLRRHGNHVEVRVADDGVGIPPELLTKHTRPAPRGFGLFSIEERLAHLGGVLEIESRPGAGTRVSLRVRVANELEEKRAP